MNAPIVVVLTTSSVFFTLEKDVLNFGDKSVASPIAQHETSKVFNFLRELQTYPGPITNEHLMSLSDDFFKTKESISHMMDDLNNRFNDFLNFLRKRGKEDKKSGYYQKIIDEILSSMLNGHSNYVVRGKKSDGVLNDQIFLTIPTSFFTAVPHFRGTYTPPKNKKTSATAEVTIVS